MVPKEINREFVHKLFVVVGLDRLERQLKFRVNKSAKRDKCVMNIRLLAEGKGPTQMQKIIDNNKKIMIARRA